RSSHVHCLDSTETQGFTLMNDNPVMERHRFIGFKNKIEFFFPFAEHFLTQRVDSEQTVSACVPIRRITRIVRMIDNSDGHLVVILLAGKGDPLCTRRPNVVTSYTL